MMDAHLLGSGNHDESVLRLISGRPGPVRGVFSLSCAYISKAVQHLAIIVPRNAVWSVRVKVIVAVAAQGSQSRRFINSPDLALGVRRVLCLPLNLILYGTGEVGRPTLQVPTNPA